VFRTTTYSPDNAAVYGDLKMDEWEISKSKSGDLKLDEPARGSPVHFEISTFGF
jgi:hypothetical protein